MEYVKLGNYTNIRTGKLDANASSNEGIYPFFTCSKNTLRINTYSYDCECVLVAGNGEINAKYYFGKFDAYQRTYIIESKDKTKLLVKYIYYFMLSYIDVLKKNSIGGVIKYIKLNNLTDALIPLLTIDEQNKLIKTFEKYYENLELNYKIYNNLETIVKSQFIEMFGNCKKDTPIADVTSEIKRGQWGDEPLTDKSNFKVIKTNNMEYDGTLDLENVVVRNIKKEKFEKNKLEWGDILVEKCGGTKTHSVGYSCLFLDSNDFVANNFIMILTPNREKINPYFLQYQLRYMYEAYDFVDCFNKTTGIQNLKVDLYKNKRICIPNMKLQNKFASFVQQVDKSKYFGGVYYGIC